MTDQQCVVLDGRKVLSGRGGYLEQAYRRLVTTGVSYAICMTVEHTLGANNGSLRRVCGGGGGGGGGGKWAEKERRGL